MTADPAAIAAKLTPAQRRALMMDPAAIIRGAIPSATGRVLAARGLYRERMGVFAMAGLTDLGLRVRAVLEARGDG